MCSRKLAVFYWCVLCWLSVALTVNTQIHYRKQLKTQILPLSFMCFTCVDLVCILCVWSQLFCVWIQCEDTLRFHSSVYSYIMEICVHARMSTFSHSVAMRYSTETDRQRERGTKICLFLPPAKQDSYIRASNEVLRM